MGEDATSRQLEEIDVLRAMYPGEGEFEMLSDMPQTGVVGRAVVFRIRMDVVAPGCSVHVTLPPNYPSQDPPSFAVEGLRAQEAGRLNSELNEKAVGCAGEECIFEILQAFVDIAPEVLQQSPAAEGHAEDVKCSTTPSTTDDSKWSWACADGDDTVLLLSVNSGPKVRKTQITNVSELRRLATAACVCIDVQPSRNTENYELASLLASCVGVSEQAVDFIAGGKKEKASGNRRARIVGVQPDVVVERILAACT
mmetsp:Transcript_16488/g.47810  ORF Transcript_16488/g.47810 Transcript_16488/m.47810 type:complete len:254 (-) Transcript_16488:56-817(-)